MTDEPYDPDRDELAAYVDHALRTDPEFRAAYEKASAERPSGITHIRAMIRAFLARLRCAITGHDYSGPPAHRLGLCNDCGLDLDDRRRFARQRGAFLARLFRDVEVGRVTEDEAAQDGPVTNDERDER